MAELLEMFRASRSFRAQILTSLFIGLLLMVVAYWAFDREHPLVFDADRSFIVPPSALGGDQMRVHWALKEPPRRNCTGDVRRVLFDPDTQVQIAIYDKDDAAGAGAYKDGFLVKTFALPKRMPKGRIGYRSDLCYACNPLQKLFSVARICYSTPDLFFEVQ